MKIYTNRTVVEASLERIRYLFDEFENVVVGISGGKDSTVTFDLALRVAREKNRLPLSVMWIDQEAEWQGTVDTCKNILYQEEVKPYWFQMPMVITNNSSTFERYNYCWDEKEKDNWIHQKDKISIKENIYGTIRFHELFENIFKVEFADKKSCYLAGVRAQEAPKRHTTLTTDASYKWITWGKILSKKLNHYTFYPIYDWSYTDVWKYIHDNKLKYNSVYDAMYSYGVGIHDMRISNVHHETAIQVLLLIQEIEPETWQRITKRIPSVNTVKHLSKKAFTRPDELPFMFDSWKEYALYLVENLVQDDANKKLIYKHIKSNHDRFYFHKIISDDYFKKVVDTVLSSDWDMTKLKNFTMSPSVLSHRRYVQGRAYPEMLSCTQYLNSEMINDIVRRISAKN